MTFLYSTHSCNFFCGYIKTLAFKRFYYTGIESAACFFLCPCGCDKNSCFFANSDSFRRGTQPDQLSQSDRSEGSSDHCSDQKFTTWRIGVVPSAQRGGPEGFYFGQNRRKNEIQRPAAEFYVRLFLFLYSCFFSLVWFGLVLWHINHCWLFNAKSGLFIHLRYMICKHKSTKLNKLFSNSIKHKTFCRYTQINDQKALFQTIQFSKSHLFAPSLNIKQFPLIHR